MKVPLHLVMERRERLAALISHNGYLPVQDLCRKLEVSEATVRRDLAALETQKRIKRTYGGAISEFDTRYPSFDERRNRSHLAKERIAATALSFITPNSTVFFDTGTTIYAIAEAFRVQPVVPCKIVTTSIPAGEILAGIDGVEVFLVGGQLLARQSVLVGPIAIQSLGFWNFDLAFLSAEGMDATGIWNSQPIIVDQQKASIRRSAKTVFCLDSTKLNRSAPDFLLPWSKVDLLLTDATVRKLQESGVMLEADHYCSATGRSRPEGLGSRQQPGEDPGEMEVHML